MKKDLLIHEVPDAAPGRRGFIRKATMAGAGGAAALFAARNMEAAGINNGNDRKEAKNTFLNR